MARLLPEMSHFHHSSAWSSDDFVAQSFPTVPHRECTIVSCPSKIMLGNTSPVFSIHKIGTPVRGLRPKSRPLIIRLELAIPTFLRHRFPSIFHAISS